MDSFPEEEATVGWLAQRLESARADAQRIAHELTSRGHLDAEQAAVLEAAVASAVSRGRELLTDALREPRRILAALRRTGAAAVREIADRGEPEDALAERIAELAGRTADLEERLVRLESLVSPASTTGD